MQKSPSFKQTPLQFNGDAFEYFKIWIVNIALTVLTLGIYSAWAKVRNKQYFYGNTVVDGQSFQYHASPIQILKGRLIAVAAYIAFSAATNFLPGSFYWVFLIAFAALIPWLINSGLRFNARMSSWRNVRFDFQGNYLGALMAFTVWPVFGVLSLGFLMPNAARYSANYLVTNHRYGEEEFTFAAEVIDYQKVIWGILLMYLVVAMVAFLATLKGIELAIGIGLIVFYLISYCIKPLLFNVYWNHVRLKKNGFHAHMSVARYVVIFLTNSFAVMLSLGLLYPWTKIRMAKFTAESLALLDTGTLGRVCAAEQSNSNAIGEEFGEVFDVDVGFGV